MKKLKKLFAVLAFCACLVIPFTACGGNIRGIVESYEYTHDDDEAANFTVTIKDSPDLQEYYYFLDIYQIFFEIYNSENLNELLTNPEFIESCKYGKLNKHKLVNRKRTVCSYLEDDYGPLKYILIYNSRDAEKLLNYVGYIEIVENR